MPQRLWQAMMGLWILVGSVIAVYEFAFPVMGVSLGTPSRNFDRGAPLQWHITAISKTSPVGKAGVVPGDVVQLENPFWEYRRGSPSTKTLMRYRVIHNGVAREIAVYPVKAAPSKLNFWQRLAPLLRFITQLSMYLVGLLLVWKRPEIRYGRALAGFLVALGVTISFNVAHYSGPVVEIGHLLFNLSIVFSLVEVLRFATLFPDPDRADLDRWRVRYWIFKTAPLFGLIMALSTIPQIVYTYQYGGYEPLLDTLWFSCWIYALTATVAALFIALSKAVGTDRQRLLYITITFFVGFIGPALTAVYALIGADYDKVVLFRLTSIVIPFGFGYAILRHRVLDLGFAINRAIVYGIVAAVVVPVLLAFEYESEHYLAASNPEFTEAVRVLLLILLALALPHILSRVNDAVDDMLFRQRALQKLALRDFTHQIQFVSDLELLLDLTIQTIDKNSECAGAAIYLYEKEGGHYALHQSSFATQPVEKISENDLAVLQMRAHAMPSDLTNVSTVLPGAEAFPMMIRGALMGFLVMGLKRGVDTYPPDELEALAGLAQATGAAIDVRIANAEREHAQRQVLEEQRRALDELQKFTDAYARFVPKAFLEHLNKSTILDVELGDHVQTEMTVMFTDIRSFTTLSESMSPRENFNFLNAYLSRVGPVVRQHHGIIDKYIGDAVMGLFPREADDAVKAGLALQVAVKRYNRGRQRAGFDPIRVGVGIHTGVLMLGTIGENERMDTTVISDAVNLASRLEGVTKQFHTPMIISGDTHAKLVDTLEDYSVRHLGRLQVVGKSEGVEVYEIYDSDEPDLIHHKNVTKERFEAAIERYHDGAFAAAFEEFSAIAAMHPGDGPAQYYYSRCEEKLGAEFQAGGPSWDGTERLLVK